MGPARLAVDPRPPGSAPVTTRAAGPQVRATRGALGERLEAGAPEAGPEGDRALAFSRRRAPPRDVDHYFALVITFTASAGVPATEVALTRYVAEDAVDVPRVTTTLSV